MPHSQPPDGYLSVTEVLDLVINKKFLQYWRGKIGNEAASKIQRESQEIGTEVHELIEARFKNYVPTSIGRKTQMVDNFWKQFVDPYKVRAVELEQTRQDTKLQLQGTFDAVIKCQKGMYIADWKTNNSLDKVSVPLQLSMYAHLSGGPGHGVVVRIDKESDEVEIKWYEDLKQYEPVWKAALKLARYIKFGEV